MTEAISARDVRVTIDGATILPQVSLTVAAGEVVTVMGANGSGKSTLLRTLVGALPHQAGTVRLLGEPLGRTVPWDRIGYVPQRVAAAGGVPATAREVVASGLLHGRRLVPPRRSRVRVTEALETVGLAHRADDPLREMSGGQQQRVLLARALVRRPDLILLDEPLAGVDLPSQRRLSDTLAHLVAHGATIVVVLHELGPLAPLIDRAVVLRHGSVAYDGTPPPARADHAGPGHEHHHPDEPGGDPAAPEVRWPA